MRDYAILCPGQGSQSPEMFDLVAADARGRETLRAFEDALGYDLPAWAGAGTGLFDNARAQPALVALASATWAMLEPELPPPALFAGYSVGEVSAWSCSGVWSPSVAAEAATLRARLMDAHAPPGCGMLAAHGLPVERLAALAEGLHPAIYNENDHAVFAGAQSSLIAAAQRLESQGARTRRLNVGVPSHTPLMADAAAEFGAWLAGVPMLPPRAPVLRGIDGRVCHQAAQSLEALPRAICEPIRWDDNMATTLEHGVTVVLELGPGRALAKLFGQAHPSVTARSVADFRSARGAIDWLLRQIDR